MARVLPTLTVLSALLLASRGLSLLKPGAQLVAHVAGAAGSGVEKTVGSIRSLGEGAADTLGSAVDRGKGVARELIYEAGSLAGKVSGELAGGFLELVGLNDTCVGEAAEGCRLVVAELVQEYLDVGDVALTPSGLWQALRERVPVHPGTKWCGAGNVARAYQDRGVLAATDACCRRHDNCPDNVAVGEEAHGLRNDCGFTRSHCECDREFYHCLKQTDTLVSHKIGVIYFDILRPQCFEETFPAVGCKRKSRSPISHCAEYELDRSGDPEWQWFDNPLY